MKLKTLAIVASAVGWAFGIASAAAPGPDPWAKVPANPTGAYQTDGYRQTLATARDAQWKDIERQQAINDALMKKVHEIDPMELASRQSQWMMDHPQEAMALMQRNQAAGQTYTDSELAANDALVALDKELIDIDARSKAALDLRLAPIKAKFDDLDKRAAKDAIVGEGGDTWRPWAVAEYNRIAAEEDAAYERHALESWGPSGPYQGWLKRVRAVYEKQIPAREENELVAAGFAMIVATPTEPFKPVAALRAVYDYMEKAGKAFAGRRERPHTRMSN